MSLSAHLQQLVGPHFYEIFVIDCINHISKYLIVDTSFWPVLILVHCSILQMSRYLLVPASNRSKDCYVSQTCQFWRVHFGQCPLHGLINCIKGHV